MPDRDRILAVLSQHRDRLEAKRAILVSQHDKAVARAAKATASAARLTTEYQSTPRGIAESIRAIEMATIVGAPRAELRTLQRQHLAAEAVSEEEYNTRSTRWGHATGDGPARGCPVGDDPHLQPLILRDQVLGSYRLDPHAPTVRVRLFRNTGAGRLRTEVTVPATVPMTLSAILSFAFDDRRTRARLLDRLHLDAQQWEPAPQAAAPAEVSR
ncbi:hypothetical protein [Gordonia sihwensis]|uniref:hypothetical protein n=1 Tax=Gordonia sihwensis TaxID=173559 RepID=UPI000ABA52D8|nr:hypothetical protein [Gordonia sihwensis]